VIAQDFVVHVNAAHVSEGHNSSNRYGLVPAFPRRRKEAGDMVRKRTLLCLSSILYSGMHALSASYKFA
jgi:hypothetical protein